MTQSKTLLIGTPYATRDWIHEKFLQDTKQDSKKMRQAPVETKHKKTLAGSMAFQKQSAQVQEVLGVFERLETSAELDDRCPCGAESEIGEHGIRDGKIFSQHFCELCSNTRVEKTIRKGMISHGTSKNKK